MVSLNYVCMSGNVGSVMIGKTGLGVSAFSMLIALDQRNSETLFVRVNVYGSLAKKCIEKIIRGDYVVVTGELMDRKKSQDQQVFLEIRAKDVIFGATLIGKRENNVESAVEVELEAEAEIVLNENDFQQLIKT